MANSSYNELTYNGLWKNNVALVQILGLCPLLAVTTTTVNGIGLGIATTLTLVLSNITVSLIRNSVRPEIRIPVFVLIIASFVTAIELAMNAYFYDLYKILGIFIPLIVTNCAILGRAEAFASRNAVVPSFIDGLMMGIGFSVILVLLGAIRELLGQGTLFAHAHLMFGETAEWMTITVIDDYNGFLLAVLPPGAFIGLGLLIALKNVMDQRAQKKAAQATITAPVEINTDSAVAAKG
ncbi:Electron transport complex protein RnfE [hydrothermal vent metagenome]|uniref:Electron transport complex protein RnfE n=1 Tax=hydrothermal vent metagenome TaxID=652676 RepID=A0A3B0ZCF9_9ZZZZ